MVHVFELSLSCVLTCTLNHFCSFYTDMQQYAVVKWNNFHKTGQRKHVGNIIQRKTDKFAWCNVPVICTPHPPPLAILGANRAFHLVFTRFKYPVVDKCTFFLGFAIPCRGWARVWLGFWLWFVTSFTRLGSSCMFAENMEAEQLMKKVWFQSLNIMLSTWLQWYERHHVKAPVDIMWNLQIMLQV